MSIITKTFFLTGGLLGQTVNLRGYAFIGGQITLSLPASEMVKVERTLRRNWSVIDESELPIDPPIDPPLLPGDDEEELPINTLSGFSADSQLATSASAGDEGILSERNGYQEKLIKALGSLDANNDSHWTGGGKPSISTVASRMGNAGVTRSDIEKVAPDLRRDKQK